MACDSGSGSSVPDGYKTVDTFNEKSTEQIYADIMELVNEYDDNYTANITYNIDIEMLGSNIPAQAVMVDKVKVSNGAFYEFTTLDLVCELAPSMNQSLFAEVWFVDDVAYLNNPKNSGSQKVKVQTDWEEFCEEAGVDAETISTPIYDFSDVSFDKIKFYIDKNVEDDKDVDPYFEMKISGEKAEEFAQKRMNKLGNQITNPEVKVSNIQYKFFITEDGDLDYVGIVYTMSISGKVQGFDVVYTYDYDGILELKDLGVTVINPPADANVYEDGIFI